MSAGYPVSAATIANTLSATSSLAASELWGSGASEPCTSADGCGGASKPDALAYTKPITWSQRWVVTQRDTVIAFDVPLLTDRGKHLSLLHRINTQISFQIQIPIQHVGRISGLGRNNRQHLVSDFVAGSLGALGLWGLGALHIG